MRTFLVLPLLLLCAAALPAADQVGRRAPGFALPDVNMKIHDLADYRGKVMILEFMQTDCVHCSDFAKVLNQVQKKYGDKIAVIAVAFSGHDDIGKVTRYAAANDIFYPILLDQGQMEFSYVLKNTVDNPCIFLIDANGIIRSNFEYGVFSKGVFELKGLSAEIDRILGGNRSVAPKK